MRPNPLDKEHYSLQAFSFVQRCQVQCKNGDVQHEGPGPKDKETLQVRKIWGECSPFLRQMIVFNTIYPATFFQLYYNYTAY